MGSPTGHSQPKTKRRPAESRTRTPDLSIRKPSVYHYTTTPVVVVVVVVVVVIAVVVDVVVIVVVTVVAAVNTNTELL
ncbi:hypothetical protein ElyMa_003521200 [Elysia marginata]|uniref:Transmembrane protein n=1 Tax=Elysia marginata TaxID=1093978 RepID=A0AAV4EH83_9GAST|nr:hypothetical protein ElyMa_003521200 [Elysia marginata]